MIIKNFNWLPNLAEVHSKIRYDFIELPLLHFYHTTSPGELNFNKMDANEARLSAESDVDMPILHFKSGENRLNCLYYFQGRHRTYAASRFSNAASKIIVMIPRHFVQEIVKALDCEIVGQSLSKYSDHDGTFYHLKVSENAETVFL